jgi:hypothetical protein
MNSGSLNCDVTSVFSFWCSVTDMERAMSRNELHSVFQNYFLNFQIFIASLRSVGHSGWSFDVNRAELRQDTVLLLIPEEEAK